LSSFWPNVVIAAGRSPTRARPAQPNAMRRMPGGSWFASTAHPRCWRDRALRSPG
jgi:hypothetical protein